MPLPHFPGPAYPLNCKEQGVSTKDGIDRISAKNITAVSK